LYIEGRHIIIKWREKERIKEERKRE
jgi:hypothetical protein